MYSITFSLSLCSLIFYSSHFHAILGPPSAYLTSHYHYRSLAGL